MKLTMAESEVTAGQEGLTRREFLKRSILAVGGAVGAKFIWDLYKDMFADVGMLAKCLAGEMGLPEPKHLYARELQQSYDKTLLVVHPGFGLLRFPNNYKDKEEYRQYVDSLKQAIEKSRSDRDLVIFLIGAEEVRAGKSIAGLSISDADLSVATSSGNPVPIACVETPEHKFIYQKIVSVGDLNNLLREKSVREINIAGEFRKACVVIAENFVKGGSFKVNILEDVTYPPKDPKV